MGFRVLDIIAFTIGIFGVLTIVWGSLKTLRQFVLMEVRERGAGNAPETSESLRHSFGTYLLLGLEFLIAADIIHTLIRPDLEALGVLGGIVAIRTVISYFLNREITQYRLGRERPAGSTGS